jgi:hypothetical protein
MRDICKLSCKASGAGVSASKAFLVLCDLYETYSFTGDYPSEEQAKVFSREAAKIMGFIEIAIDYVYQTKESIDFVDKELGEMLVESSSDCK